MLAAMAMEIAPIAMHFLKKTTRMRRRKQTMYGNLTIAWSSTGIGGERMARMAREIFAQRRPDHVVLLGFAGALDPTLRRGDLRQITEVRYDEQAVTHPLHVLPLPGISQCKLVTTRTIIADVSDKQALHQQHNADLVDMESWDLAELCAEEHIPLTVLRAVSDTASDTLPAWATKLTKPEGVPDVPQAIRHLLTHPQHFPAMMRMSRGAKRATRSLIRGAELALNELADTLPR